jgi:NAD(P)-dependent dehydrogenase (short-subunit alcohol dehydrogenase family)
MNWSFENNVALVTGAGSGMGLATAKAEAAAGASVVLADIQEEAVRAEASHLETSGRKAGSWLRCER